jgi:endonuclease-8
MPEGDTIHRTANRLRPALAGNTLRRFEAARLPGGLRPPRAGTNIDSVEAVGKHLLIGFADGTTVHTHLRMSGSWHLYRNGERWKQPRHLARLVIEVDGWTAVCFSAPVVELTRDPGADLAHLGPDLTRDDLDDAAIDEAIRRMDVCVEAHSEIGAVLLDQRVSCGVGNVFKSEVLFACGVDPFASVASLETRTRRRLLSTASAMLRINTRDSGPRSTLGGNRRGLAVYGREGRPCRRCGTPIRRQRQGEQARSTYWCPTCQASGS